MPRSPSDQTAYPKLEAISAEASTVWSRISFGAPDSWIDDICYDPSLVGKEGAHLTYLLWMRQVHVDLNKSFHATATRLETPLAVQHQSQWQLNFDPRCQHVMLHWLRVVRNGAIADQLHRERMRIIQRESQLEHLVIDGNWTLLVVLDNVRPGDIIEAAYSIVTRHPIRPSGCEILFVVPPNIVTGRYELGVRFNPSRPDMSWKSSPDAPVHSSGTTAEGLSIWKWSGHQSVLREPEFNEPSTVLDYIWVQISDLAEWKHLISRVAQAWDQTLCATDLGALIGLPRPSEVTATSISQAIKHIQDEFRYLSVDLESGGWVPAQPETIARRRYGDCKDLTWLATVLLRAWGVTARPILVGTGLRRRVGELLPMALLLNHAVLEVEIAGKRRWFDLTLRLQGGDFDQQPIADFEVGLPVDATADCLCKQPAVASAAIYAHRETILLDTRLNKPSAVEIRVRAEGWHAENLRRVRQAQGADGFCVERLKHFQGRYAKATRTGTLEWRDNREQNVCELVETFNVNGVVYLDERGERALFDVTANLLVNSIPVPEDKPRRTPWDMLHPIDLRQEILIKAPGTNSGKRRRRRWSSPEFIGLLDEPRCGSGWSKVMRFTSCVSEVSPDRVQDFRRALDQFLQATTWRLYLPKDQSCPYDHGEQWGKLPPIDSGLSAYVEIGDPATFPDAKEDPDPNGGVIVHEGNSPIAGLDRPTRPWYLLVPALLVISWLARIFSSSTEAYYSSSRIPPAPDSETWSVVPNPVNGGNNVVPPPSSFFQSGPGVVKRYDVVDPTKLGPTFPPQLLATTEPRYPVSLSLSRTSGTVTVEFVVDTSGKVKDLKTVEGSDSRFSESAISALSHWEFVPAHKDNLAISQTVRASFTFHPDGVTLTRWSSSP